MEINNSRMVDLFETNPVEQWKFVTLWLSSLFEVKLHRQTVYVYLFMSIWYS